MNKIANSISWLFLPLFIPVYTLGIVIFDAYNLDFLFDSNIRWALMQLFFLFLTMAPGSTFLLLKRRKIIKDLEMSHKKDRQIPLIIVCLYASALFAMIYIKDEQHVLPFYIYAIPLIGASVSWVFFLSSFWFKLSLHTGTMGMACGFIFTYTQVENYFSIWYLFGAIICSGLVGFSRLYLQRHKATEIYLGWLLGFVLAFAISGFTYYYQNQMIFEN